MFRKGIGTVYPTCCRLNIIVTSSANQLKMKLHFDLIRFFDFLLHYAITYCVLNPTVSQNLVCSKKVSRIGSNSIQVFSPVIDVVLKRSFEERPVARVVDQNYFSEKISR